MTAKTPVFQLEYITEGEPVRNARLALENNAKTTEAALVRGGIAPPAAQDLATLSGRVTAIEQASPTGIITWSATFAANPVSPLVVRNGPGKMSHLVGLARNTVVVGGVTGTWFTLPAGFRPAETTIDYVMVEGGGLVDVQIGTDGVVAGIGLRLGGYPIPTPRYWAFNTTFARP